MGSCGCAFCAFRFRGGVDKVYYVLVTGRYVIQCVVRRGDHEYARLERGFAAPRRCQLFR